MFCFHTTRCPHASVMYNLTNMMVNGFAGVKAGRRVCGEIQQDWPDGPGYLKHLNPEGGARPGGRGARRSRAACSRLTLCLCSLTDPVSSCLNTQFCPEFVETAVPYGKWPRSFRCAGDFAPGQAEQEASVPVEYCSTILAMMSWDHLDSDLCQHVITLINRALDSPDGPHKGTPKCLVLRQRLVNALLDRGLMRVITDLQELVQESLFQV